MMHFHMKVPVKIGEVIALLNISKCLYDIILRMESTFEKGKAIAVAIEGVENNEEPPIMGPFLQLVWC